MECEPSYFLIFWSHFKVRYRNEYGFSCTLIRRTFDQRLKMEKCKIHQRKVPKQKLKTIKNLFEPAVSMSSDAINPHAHRTPRQINNNKINVGRFYIHSIFHDIFFALPSAQVRFLSVCVRAHCVSDNRLVVHEANTINKKRIYWHDSSHVSSSIHFSNVLVSTTATISRSAACKR